MALKEEIHRRHRLIEGHGVINLMEDNEGSDASQSHQEVHPHDDLEDYHHLYHGTGCYDDVHGKFLDKEMAIKARKLGMGFFKRMEVHTKVDRSTAKLLKATFTTTQWIDANKGDDRNRGCMARLVGREIKTDQRPEIFAAMSPFESLRMILAICASNQHIDDPLHILSCDSKRAYFFAKAKGYIFAEDGARRWKQGWPVQLEFVRYA